MKNILRLLPVLVMLLALVLTGCTTFYSASVLGHESMVAPFNEFGESSTRLGLSAKTAPTRSIFTTDATDSVQGGLVMGSHLSLADLAGLDFQLGISAYHAWTRLGSSLSEPIPAGSRDPVTYPAWGLSGQALAGPRFRLGPTSLFLGLKAMYNREFGDYPQARAHLPVTYVEGGESRINLSPSGSTLSLMAQMGHKVPLGDGYALDWGMALGTAMTEVPDPGHRVMLSELYLAFSAERFWFWAAWDSMQFLNSGLSIGLGFWLL